MADCSLADTLRDMLREILAKFDERVSERGTFPDLRVTRDHHFGDPAIHRPGRLELIVMSMDPKLDPKFDFQRFLSVRVIKSVVHGYVSLSCFHGTRAELRAQLEAQAARPDLLLGRIRELADGLPEETNPEIWR
jgi:hypothetical protein